MKYWISRVRHAAYQPLLSLADRFTPVSIINLVFFPRFPILDTLFLPSSSFIRLASLLSHSYFNLSIRSPIFVTSSDLKMSTPFHKELADTLQRFHDDLRQNFQVSENWDDAWENHKKQNENLKTYAQVMHQLATEVWDKNNPKDYSRIDWVVKTCLEYFKEAPSDSKLKLFDVGSCYNPFQKFDFFDVTAIDLYPAPGFQDQIIKGDFLEINLPINSSSSSGSKFNQGPLEIRPPYDIVVFSFFLEYLPSKIQRRKATIIGANLLRPGGLLFILRPDSKPAGQVNSRLIKQLKVGAGLVGLKRVYLEKLQHLWCMAFVKLEQQDFENYTKSERFLRDVRKVQCEDEAEYFEIAQDVKEYPSGETEMSPKDNSSDCALFLELPVLEVIYNMKN